MKKTATEVVLKRQAVINFLTKLLVSLLDVGITLLFIVGMFLLFNRFGTVNKKPDNVRIRRYDYIDVDSSKASQFVVTKEWLFYDEERAERFADKN